MPESHYTTSRATPRRPPETSARTVSLTARAVMRMAWRAVVSVSGIVSFTSEHQGLGDEDLGLALEEVLAVVFVFEDGNDGLYVRASPNEGQ